MLYKDSIIQMVKDGASRSSIDYRIILAIIAQESNFNPWTTRYEPSWNYIYEDVHNIVHLLGITLSTEIQCQKMSWGLGQIMGSTARSLGMVDHLTKLVDPSINILYIYKTLQGFNPHDTKTTPELFSCYNGGLGALLKVKDGKFPNQTYVDSAMEHYKSFGG